MSSMRNEFYYDSCGSGKIHACRWEPEGKPRGIVQLVHGIAEYVLRYDDFAQFLANKGYLVVGEDHMGHGLSISGKATKGYFFGGWFAAVDDTVQLMRMTQAQFPDVPYVLFGHSMGSFMARTILAKYPDLGLSACVICGTGWQPAPILKAGLLACKSACKKIGPENPSTFVYKMAFGAYNKRVEHPRTAFDWLNRDHKAVDEYVADPLCGFVASAGLMNSMMEGLSYIQNKTNLQRMPKDVPVYFIAGGDDPVGDFGNGVRKTAEQFRKAGMEDVAVKIYPLCRHEILNEINNKQVYTDVLNWIEEQLP